jgi:hypothetical protein
MRLLAAILFLLFALPVQAQQSQGMSQAVVVGSCGGALPSGALNQLTMDTTGRLCLGGAVVTPTSVWAPADAVTNGMTLSNGGLTVAPSGAASYKSIRGSTSKTTGKLYVEFSVDAGFTSAAGGPVTIGLASSGADISSYLGNSNYSAGIFPAISNSVSTGFVSNYTTAAPAIAASTTYGLAVDFGAGKVWLAANNVWYNSSNPATGTLPVVSFTLATVGSLFPGLSFFGPNLGLWTLHAAAASLIYAPPSGFQAWDAP